MMIVPIDSWRALVFVLANYSSVSVNVVLNIHFTPNFLLNISEIFVLKLLQAQQCNPSLL